MAKAYKHRKTVTIEGQRYDFYADSAEELYTKIANKKRDIEEGRVLVTGSMSVAQWVEICLKTYKSDVKPETLESMTGRIHKHILSAIGNYPLKAVKPIQCQAIMNDQIGMSYSHIRSLKQELKFIFQKALENHLILENPAANITAPKGKKGARRALTDHERKHFLAVAEKDPAYNLFLLILYCGCRPAEAVKCQGNDIKVSNGRRMLHIRGTKSDNSDRYVPMPDVMYQRIADKGPFDILCPNAAGRKHSESSYKRLVDRLRRDMNISMGCRVYRNQLLPPFPLAEDFVPYDLRHTYCTDLQKAGVDIRTAQRLMGHADIRITANIYTHVDMNQIESAADILSDYHLA